MSARRLLVIGENMRSRRKIVSMLRGLHSISVTEVELGAGNIQAVLSNRRSDVMLLECGIYLEEAAGAAKIVWPGTPVVGYADAPGYAITRKAFKFGLKDVLDIKTVQLEEIREVLEWAIDPASAVNVVTSVHIIQCVEEAKKRGVFLERQMQAGSPPPFYMNGNRAEILRADIMSLKPGFQWRDDASKVWVEEFGTRNSMIFSERGGALRVGAIIEQDYVNRASFKKTLDVKLAHCFSRFEALGYVCAATYCSADYLSASIARQLDSLTDMVFYLEDCKLFFDGQPRRNSILPDRVYNEFSAAVAVRDADSAIRCIDGVVDRLRQDMPPPGFARDKLMRFLWHFVAVAHSETASAEISLRVDDSRLTALRDSICAIVRAALSQDAENGGGPTPIEALIKRIETNPGLSINIDQAAEDVGFSRSHFCRLFRQQTGLSFNAFLTRRRLKLACDLLENTGMQPDEVSPIVGIPNTWYFKKVFCEEIGTPVDEWIRAHRKGYGG
jgi:AraC-like DNA-binding protein